MALQTVPVTIPAGQSMSNPIDCSGCVRLVRIIMPAAWTFAPITFQMSPDGVNYHDLRHVTPGSLDSYEVTLSNIVPNASLTFPPTTGAVPAWIKIRSGTYATPVKQVATRMFELVMEMAAAAEVVVGPTGPSGVAGPTGATGPVLASQAATGPTGGYVQSGNIITQWGSFVASTAGVTVNFPRPYIDGPPSVTASAASGGVLQVSATKTSVTISCNSGTPMVSWKAIGS